MVRAAFVHQSALQSLSKPPLRLLSSVSMSCSEALVVLRKGGRLQVAKCFGGVSTVKKR